MRVPNLSSLTLTPLDVTGVGVEGPQCDPRAPTRGLCVIARPSRPTLNQVERLVPKSVNYGSTGLAFRIDPSSSQWLNQTPYETMYESHQFSAFTRMLNGRVPEFTLMYKDATSGEWVDMKGGLTWEQLAKQDVLPPPAPKKNKFWLKLRYSVHPIDNAQNTVRVLMAMYKYNVQHPPMWLLQKRKNAENAAAASSRPAAPPPPPPPPPPQSPPTLPPLEEMEKLFFADAWFKEQFLTSMQDVPAFVV